MKTLILTFLIILMIFPAFGQPPTSDYTFSKQVSDSVDTFIHQRMKEIRIPGLALAVIKDGEILKMKSYGTANLETNTPVTSESVFMIASLTKQFIAFAVLVLHQEGKLSINNNISNYLDKTPEIWKDITLKHLLSHTSGIDRDPSDYNPYTEQPITDVIEAMHNVQLLSKPGEKWLYSNVGYYILAEVISKVSDQPWNEFITQRILAPIDMTNTRITSTRDIIPNRVSGYHNTEKGRINAENWIAARPSGGFLSTIEDLAKWDIFLDNQDILDDSNYKLLFKENLSNSNGVIEYGMGWYIHKFLDRTRIHHDGQYPGFRADYERFTEDGLTVIVLANSDNRGLERIAMKIGGFYDPDLAGPIFNLEAKALQNTATLNTEISLTILVKAIDKDASNCIIEIEIWDENGKPVFKQQKYDENFITSETKTLVFNWTPDKPGIFSINVGVFGPGWAPNLAWRMNLASITVK